MNFPQRGKAKTILYDTYDVGEDQGLVNGYPSPKLKAVVISTASTALVFE